jgi:hypothetical protein
MNLYIYIYLRHHHPEQDADKMQNIPGTLVGYLIPLSVNNPPPEVTSILTFVSKDEICLCLNFI